MYRTLIATFLFLSWASRHGFAQEQLTCIACEAGTFLDDGLCVQCPANSFTLAGVNGSSIAACECVAGYTNASSVECSPCGLDTFKTTLGNFSCVACPENTQTLATGAVTAAACVCDPGFARDEASGVCAECAAGTFKTDAMQTAPEGPVQYTLTYLGGQYALDGVQSPALTLYRGVEVVIAWPSGHPLHITAENVWRGADISGLVVDAVAQTTTITLDAAHQDALYYYCYAHESMGVHAITVASPLVAEAECKVCTVGGYCPIGSVSPTACPADSTSAENATSIRDCQCAAGFFADFGVDGEGAETLACVPCPAGTFNPADSAETINAEQCVACPTNTYFTGTGAVAQGECVSCPAHASAPAGSGEATACLCALGYAGEPGEECVACVSGFFRSNASEYICEACPAGSYHDVDVYASTNLESCLPCPADTSSGAGSGSASACVCDAGHYAADAASRELWSAAWQCEPCAGGSFSTAGNASACELCAAGKYSAATGASTPDTCVLCAAGEFTLNAGSVACELCAPGTWQDAGAGDHTRAIACLACPQYSGHGLNGSVSVDDCVCAEGFFKDVSAAAYEPGDVFECAVCTAGSACPGNNSVVPCPVNHYAEAGASVCVQCPPNSEGMVAVGLLRYAQCQCVPGYQGFGYTACSACPAGQFQGLDYTYDSADAGLRAEIEAKLQAYGFPSLIAEFVWCEACGEGTFSNAPGQSVCLTCTANASSPAGSDANTDCACEAGFYGPDGGPCVQCPAGSFCVGGLSEAQTCRLHSTSAAGAASEAECACVAGYFSATDDGACQKCPAGSYCPGGLVVEECAVNSTSLAGAAAGSACTCAPGTWRGCTPVEGGGAVDSNNEPCEIDFLLPCEECGEDVVCLNNTLLHCPEHSTAPAGSSHSEDCVCEGGYFNEVLFFA